MPAKELLQLLSRKQFPTYFTYEKLCISEFKAIYMYIWCDKEEADNIHQTYLKLFLYSLQKMKPISGMITLKK